MTIIDKITTSIKMAMGEGFEVYYHDDPTLNVLTSRMDMPCAVVQLLTTGDIIRGAVTRERVSAAVSFIDRSEFDFDAVRNEEIIDACKRRAFAWLQSLPLGSEIAVGEARWQRLYDTYDDIVTGYTVLADIEEVTGECI